MTPAARHWAALILFVLVPAVSAEAPLHQRIDQAIAAATPNYAKKAAGLATDAEFLRRVTLDLTGTIPTGDAARAFLNDPSPAKRPSTIDRLLASPAHARHLADVFDVLLMERREDRNGLAGPWKEFLRASFAANKPWDQLVREILASDGADPATRPAACFFLNREAEPHLLTRDISRLFLGMNLHCAQCHDHPKIEDYTQDDYYGLFAFLNRTVLYRDRAKKISYLGEKADGEVTFVSVFDPAKKVKGSGPHMPDQPRLKEPPAEKGKEYLVAPVKDARPVARYSRRGLLGPRLTDPANVAFRRNLANRLWALLMGRGLVHPVDLDHPGNPPSHPELLTLLADDLAAHKFDMRYFLRELALSRTYQLSSELPAGVKEEPARFTAANLKPLSPEQMAASLLQATGQVDAMRKAQGAKATEESLRKFIVGNMGPIVRTFAGAAGAPQTFDARTDQALFLANGATVRNWLAPRPGDLTNRLVALKNSDAVADELYLSVFTRYPSEEERKDVADYLASRPQERPAALQELAWALLASAEFRFNH